MSNTNSKNKNVRNVGCAWDRTSNNGNEYVSIKLGTTPYNGTPGYSVYLVNDENDEDMVKLSELWVSMFLNKQKGDNDKAPDYRLCIFED